MAKQKKSTKHIDDAALNEELLRRTKIMNASIETMIASIKTSLSFWPDDDLGTYAKNIALAGVTGELIAQYALTTPDYASSAPTLFQTHCDSLMKSAEHYLSVGLTQR